MVDCSALLVAYDRPTNPPEWGGLRKTRMLQLPQQQQPLPLLPLFQPSVSSFG
jgi:hypothetical protein